MKIGIIMTFGKILAAGAVLAGLATGTAAQAQEPLVGKGEGAFILRLRGLAVIPQPSSSISVIGGKVDASTTFDPEIDFSYFLTDNIALELIAATTRHKITAKGTAIGDVDVGHVRLLPPTLTAQYHFWPKSAFSPYVGAGVNYTFFFDKSVGGGAVNKVSYDNNFGAAIQAGFDYNVSGRWFLNFDIKQIFLNTTAKINGGAIRANVDLNPTIVGVGFGYRF